MTTRRRSGRATARSPRVARAVQGEEDERLNELANNMAEMQETINALATQHAVHNSALDPSRSSDVSIRTMEAMTNALAALSTRATRSNGAGSDEDDEFNASADPKDVVPEMRVADPRFASLLLVSTYLLSRRSPVVLPRQVAKLSKRAAELRPRLGNYFDGTSPLAVLPFLQRVREIAEEAGLTEGIVLRILPDLLAEPALTSYRSAKPPTYPEAVKWFLLTYAPESRVAESWRDLQQIHQEDPETATEFSLRLQKAAHELGGLVKSSELKALYEGGLQDGTRHLFRATMPPDPNRTLSDSIAAAEALSQAVRAARGERAPAISRTTRLGGPRHVFALPEVGSDEEMSTEAEEPVNVSTEIDFGTVVCYGAPNAGAPPRARAKVRLCWTCWLPGHFSDECPLIPDVTRAEIAERKRRALVHAGQSTRPFSNNGANSRRPGLRPERSELPRERRAELPPRQEEKSENPDRRGPTAPEPRL
jgi:hypothetical protein